jgi:hypothetical protein
MTIGPQTNGKRAGLAVVFLWFFVGGIAHFVATDLEMRIVPPYIPWPRAAVLVNGVFELLGALGLLWLPTRRAAWDRAVSADDRGDAVPHLHAAASGPVRIDSAVGPVAETSAAGRAARIDRVVLGARSTNG